MRFNNFTPNDQVKPGSFVLVKEPNQVRSVHAAFDPKKKDSSNLPASAPPAAAAATTLWSQDIDGGDLAIGAGEVALAGLTGLISPAANGAKTFVESLSPYVSDETLEDHRAARAEALQYDPRTPIGRKMAQDAMQAVGAGINWMGDQIPQEARDAAAGAFPLEGISSLWDEYVPRRQKIQAQSLMDIFL